MKCKMSRINDFRFLLNCKVTVFFSDHITNCQAFICFLVDAFSLNNPYIISKSLTDLVSSLIISYNSLYVIFTCRPPQRRILKNLKSENAMIRKGLVRGLPLFYKAAAQNDSEEEDLICRVMNWGESLRKKMDMNK